MAKLTPSNKYKIFQQLNMRKMPWENSRFVLKEDEFEWLGSGNFSEVYEMEDVNDSNLKYAVKIIGFNEHRRIHQSDIESYKKEPILQYELANQCNTVVKIIDAEVISVKLDANGNIQDARLDDVCVEKPGWLTLVLIKMEKLLPVIEQNFTGDYDFKILKLKNADIKEILSLAINIAEALVKSHSMEIMHRDVKLENVFYDEVTRTYKLGDFGIARVTNQGIASTMGAGTLGYEAPEVEGGNGEKYSYQADIYSFGVTIYLLLNELKFPGSTGYHVNRSVQYNPNSIIKAPLHGTPKLKIFVCSLLRFNPAERPENMSDVLVGLQEILKGVCDDKEVHIIEKKPQIVKEEVETIKSDMSITVTDEETIESVIKKESANKEESDVKKDSAIKEESCEDSAVKGNVVAEVKEDLDSPKSGAMKGVLGCAFLCFGLLYFSLLSGESLDFFRTPMVKWSLIANSVVSIVSIILKITNKKNTLRPFYFILFCFSIYVMITGGMSWLYIVISIALLLGRVTAVFAVLLSVWLYILSINTNFLDLNAVCNEDFAGLFLMMAILGLILSLRFDKKKKKYSTILPDGMIIILFGILTLIAGIVIWVLNVIPMITVASLLMKMHFIYVGVFLGITGVIITAIDVGRT